MRRCNAWIGRIMTLWLAFTVSPAWTMDAAAFVSLLIDGGAAEQYRWATRFAHAEGVERDYEKAIQLYCLSAGSGFPDAQYQLGWLYAHGRGVSKDDALAAAWFRQAAAQGNLQAARMMNLMDERQGRKQAACILSNGRPVLPALNTVAEPAPELIAAWVQQLSPYYDLDPALVMAVIQAESSFNPKARSPKGAKGLMQLMPGTARRFGVSDIWDPLKNLNGGMAYLRWLLDHFDGDLTLALAGYNAGEHAVERYQGVPPYAETRLYVRRVSALMKRGNNGVGAG